MHTHQPHRIRTTLALLALCASPAALLAQGGAAEGGSRITAVKLYPGSASVERTLRVAAGARQAVFACLPARLDAASLQVSADAGVRVGELAVRQQTRALLGPACASPLDERIRALQDQIAGVQGESGAVGYGLGYLKSFEHAGNGADARAPSAAQVGAAVAALRESASQALARQHQLQHQQEALERELAPLLAERERSGGPEAPVSTVQVTLAAPQGGSVRLTYPVRGPGWQPSYRATLDSRTQKLRLERLAQVAQSSGEDWSEVPLVLSTGQPGSATQGPLPRPWRVGIQPPVAAAPAMMAAPAAAPAMAARAKSEATADEAPGFDVSVFQGTFATEFTVPQRVTVPSNGERVALTLGEQTLDTQLVVRSTPALDASGYLIAAFATPPGVWPAGPVSLYRDGALVGTGRFDAATASRDGLAFGRDELLSVRVERPEQQQGTGGFIGTRNQRTDSRRYTVENRHTTPVTLQLLDAAPVSDNEAVRVESRYQPAPQTERWHEQPGTVAWELPLAAGSTQSFSAEHLITWPKDARLQDRR